MCSWAKWELIRTIHIKTKNAVHIVHITHILSFLRRLTHESELKPTPYLVFPKNGLSKNLFMVVRILGGYCIKCIMCTVCITCVLRVMCIIYVYFVFTVSTVRLVLCVVCALRGICVMFVRLTVVFIVFILNMCISLLDRRWYLCILQITQKLECDFKDVYWCLGKVHRTICSHSQMHHKIVVLCTCL
jgi:hypothetical protein